MGKDDPYIYKWVIKVSGYSSVIATIIIMTSIIFHLRNYRRPHQQRLIIRIQVIVPLFALSCFCMLTKPESCITKYFLEPTKEVYEAFVIYTFFSLLTDMLGGERNIIIMTSGRVPVAHPGILKHLLPDVDVSDPFSFLFIKRGILQYVWLKPLICISIMLTQAIGWYNVNKLGITSIYLWLTVIYNASVTLSLYCLALFWKILWNDLKPFSPIGKFLCVKLIIFASYWQGVALAILHFSGLLQGSSVDEGTETNISVFIQNALLCLELVPFAIGHWFSFSYKPFQLSRIPGGRLEFLYALKDFIGVQDLIYDFKLTFYGDYYKDYRRFDSVEALISHPESNSRMSRINCGLRYNPDGTQKYWLPKSHPHSDDHVQSTSEAQFLLGDVLNDDNASITPTLKSNNTSMRVLYPKSSKNISPPESTNISNIDLPHTTGAHPITDALNTKDIQYDKERLEEDELLYEMASSEISNYNLGHAEVRNIINYPIIDELVGGHIYGYKVKKLRESRNQRKEPQGKMLQRHTHEQSYGSIN